MSVVLHPKWVEKAGIGDITRHLQTRGFVVTYVRGSKFYHAVVVRIPTSADLINDFETFRPQPQRR